MLFSLKKRIETFGFLCENINRVMGGLRTIFLEEESALFQREALKTRLPGIK